MLADLNIIYIVQTGVNVPLEIQHQLSVGMKFMFIRPATLN